MTRTGRRGPAPRYCKASCRQRAYEARRAGRPDREPVDPDTASQIAERLRWTPAERLAYLRDVVAFERRAALARRVP